MASQRTVTESAQLECEVSEEGELMLGACVAIILGICEFDYQPLNGNHCWLLMLATTT
jgi:hypothetical protein